jgi:hypothetical protein
MLFLCIAPAACAHCAAGDKVQVNINYFEGICCYTSSAEDATAFFVLDNLFGLQAFTWNLHGIEHYTSTSLMPITNKFAET